MLKSYTKKCVTIILLSTYLHCSQASLQISENWNSTPHTLQQKIDVIDHNTAIKIHLLHTMSQFNNNAHDTKELLKEAQILFNNAQQEIERLQQQDAQLQADLTWMIQTKNN